MKDDFASLKPHPGNPRTITPAKARALRKALKEFGDLGGVVLNQRTNQLVSGHQRMNAFNASDFGRIEIKTTFQTPTRAGTVAEGFLVVDQERYAYRVVDWDEKTHKAAALAANRQAGDWDMSALTTWLNDLNSEGFDMTLTMFDDAELGKMLTPLQALEPQQQKPKKDYDPDTGEVVEFVAHKDSSDSVKGQPEAMQVVQVFLDTPNYHRFLECVDSLQMIYKKNSTSETIVEAVNRASVSEAIK